MESQNTLCLGQNEVSILQRYEKSVPVEHKLLTPPPAAYSTLHAGKYIPPGYERKLQSLPE